MRTRAPSFSASEVRFARASYCKCLTSHLPRCALVHTHIGQPHASHAARNTCTSPDTCAETALGILALASLSRCTRTSTLTCTILSLGPHFYRARATQSGTQHLSPEGLGRSTGFNPTAHVAHVPCALVAHAGGHGQSRVEVPALRLTITQTCMACRVPSSMFLSL
jgi:hypothetical protein